MLCVDDMNDWDDEENNLMNYLMENPHMKKKFDACK